MTYLNYILTSLSITHYFVKRLNESIKNNEILISLFNDEVNFSGTVAEMIKKTLNADIPYVPWLTGYLAIAMGAVLTFIVQSSSVFTTTLTPLVGVGLISVERVYPLTLGSNLGTTTTAMIASLAAEGSDRLRNSLQIALCHFFFNFTGILLFYPIPFMRWPLVLCKILGRTTAQYRYKMTNTINLNFLNSNRQVKQNGKKAFISFTLP